MCQDQERRFQNMHNIRLLSTRVYIYIQHLYAHVGTQMRPILAQPCTHTNTQACTAAHTKQTHACARIDHTQMCKQRRPLT